MILVHCLKPSLRLIEQQGAAWSAHHLQLNLMNVKNLLHKRTSHRLPLYFILLNQNKSKHHLQQQWAHHHRGCHQNYWQGRRGVRMRGVIRRDWHRRPTYHGALSSDRLRDAKPQVRKPHLRYAKLQSLLAYGEMKVETTNRIWSDWKIVATLRWHDRARGWGQFITIFDLLFYMIYALKRYVHLR